MKIYRFVDLIFNNKSYRRLILIFGDLLVIPFAIIISLYLRYDSYLFNIFDYSWLFVFTIFFSLPLYILLGQYKSLSSYFGFRILISSLLRNILISSLTNISGNYLSLSTPPLSLWILIVLNITSCNLIFRYIIRKILISYFKNNKYYKTKIAIYGAGISGVNLAS